MGRWTRDIGVVMLIPDTSHADIEAAIADLDADVVIVDSMVDTIEEKTSALPTLTRVGGTVTTTVINTEYDIYINDVPLGIYRPVIVKVNFTDHTAGETVVLREYYRAEPGVGAQVRCDAVTFAGVPDNPLVKIGLDPTRYGVKTTIERTAGAARDYKWEAFYEI